MAPVFGLAEGAQAIDKGGCIVSASQISENLVRAGPVGRRWNVDPAGLERAWYCPRASKTEAEPLAGSEALTYFTF